MHKYDILTIGTATRDVFLRDPEIKSIHDPHFTAKKGFPEGVAECFPVGAKIDIDSMTLTTGGGATNAAVTFARQGLGTACLFKIGDDAVGDDIVSELLREKVMPIAVRDKKLPSGYATLLLSQDGERTILVHRGASETLAIKDIHFDRLKADWCYIVPGNIPFPVIKKLTDVLHSNGVLLAMNPSKAYLKMGIAKLKPLFNKMKVVILNREEAAMITGEDFDNEEKVFAKMDEWVDGIVVVTDGHRGVLVSDGTTIFKAGVFKEKKIADRTGAGDAFGSGFVAALAKNNSSFGADTIAQAIRLASANATSVVEHVGAKEGILHARDLEEKRWKEISIHAKEIDAGKRPALSLKADS